MEYVEARRDAIEERLEETVAAVEPSELGAELEHVVLAGGTQLATAGALVRHADIEDPLTLATTSFVSGDGSANVRELAASQDLDLRVTDPGFDERSDHPAMAAYLAGEAKEGVGMGGALALADDAGLGMAAVRDSLATVYERVTERAEATL